MKAFIQRALSWLTHSPIVSLVFSLAIAVVIALAGEEMIRLGMIGGQTSRVVLGVVVLGLASVTIVFALTTYGVRKSRSEIGGEA